MKIYSPFRDYYDSVGATGVDASIKYVREHAQILIPSEGLNIPTIWRAYKGSIGGPDVFRVEFSLIGFCGQFYPVARLTDFRKFQGEVKAFSCCFYDNESLENYLKLMGIVLEKSFMSYFEFNRNYGSSPRAREAFFAKPEIGPLKPYFAHLNAPVFQVLYEEDRPGAKACAVIANGTRLASGYASLEAMEFYKVKDPFTTWQEIAAYVGGVLQAPAPQTAKVSDATMAKKRGHDGRYSFRKPPAAKKPKVRTKVGKKRKKVKK